jgi:hypothetical protein
MSSQYATRLIRLGLWTLPMIGLLKLIGNLGTFNSVGYGIPASQEALTVSGSGFFIGEFVGSILPVVLGFFGFFALFAYLFNTSAQRWATIAMVLSVIGSALILPPLGVVNYAFPVIGQAYLAGDPGVFSIVDNFFRFPLVLEFFPALFAPLGTIFFSIGIWKSRALSRWAGVLYAVSALLLSIPLPIHIIRLIGGILAVLAGAWIVASVLRQPDSQVKAQSHLSMGQ